ncbi:MAG: tetratricopeptide repeat protein [Bacteroidales bacterium]|nr:tetratricopeptide repeat protein [Bacteroidales bacterium]
MKSCSSIIIILSTYLFFIVHYNYAQSSGIVQQNNTENIEGLLSGAQTYMDIDLDSCLILGNMAYDLAVKLDFLKYQYEATKIMADAWYYKDSLSKAIDYYRLSADLISEIKGEDSEDYAARLSDIGYCFYELEIFDFAVEYFKQSLEIFTIANNILEISNQLNNIGIVYFTWGNYNLAIEHFSRTLSYDIEHGDSLSLSASYNNIGKVYETWGYQDLAIDHYLQSLSFLSGQKNESRRAIRMSNIGTSYFEKKDFDKALEYLHKALEIDQRLQNHYKIAIRYNEIAGILTAQEKFSEAIDFNQQALEIFKYLDKKESQAIVLKDLGHIYLQLGNYNSAKKYFEECIPIARNIGSRINEMAVYKSLAQLYERQNNYDQSYYYHQKYDVLKDSIFNAQQHQQLANYRIKYETQKKERENQLLKKDILIKQRSQRTFLIIAASMLLLSILLFFLLRLKSKSLKQNKLLHHQENKLTQLELEKKEIETQHLQDKVFAEKQVNRLQREKYEAEIQLKNRELVSSTLQLVNKNEVLSEIKNKIKLHNAAIPENAFRDIMHLVNQNTDFDQNWKSFRVEFEKINPGFFDRIRHKYPDFSEQFTRLAAFLRIDLSTKEIAQLMNVSVAAVNKNRQRLRKKLNLEPEADLSTFMKSI